MSAPLITGAIAKAISQLSDPRFRRVVLMGIGASLGALLLSYLALFYLVGWLVGDGLTLPFVGTLTWAADVASWASVVVMVGLSVFLMVPIAQAVQSLFLDDIAQAVEDRHYAHLPPATPVPLMDALADGLAAVGVLVLANMLALLAYLLFAPLAPLLFYALNGFLLGREYFQVAAMRREGRPRAAQLRRQHLLPIWALGTLMAVPLTIPLVNLAVPVLGAAAFTHLYHGLSRASASDRFSRPEGSSGQRSPDPGR